MGNNNTIVPRFFVAVIALVLVAAYVATQKLPLIWHLLDLMAFFAVLLVNVPASKRRTN